jgi:hypothetical protein
VIQIARRNIAASWPTDKGRCDETVTNNTETFRHNGQCGEADSKIGRRGRRGSAEMTVDNRENGALICVQN